MKCKKWMSLALCLVMVLSLTACGSKETAVYVQNVGELMNMGGIAPGDRFAGLVVSENVTEVQKDGNKTIAELKVKEGDDVKEGQVLFAYDTEELQLALDKQQLELEQLKASIENFEQQIKDLEKASKNAGTADKLRYIVQIQTTQVDLKEAQLNIKTKEAEVNKSIDILENAEVKSPVAGRIQSINENDTTDRNGRPLAFIVIQQEGAYRVKGTLGELQRGGIVAGDKLRILSRTDKDMSWTGTVTLVDYDSPIQGNNNNGMYIMGGGSDEMTNTSKYPFYVELDSTQGLLLGQHVYLEMDSGENRPGISGAFLVFEEDGSAYVWAEKGNKLEKRPVTLGEYNPMSDTYEILDGLTGEDFIAFPNAELCREGAPTTHEYVEPEAGEEGAADGGMAEGMIDGGMADGGMVDSGMVEGEIAEGEMAGGEAAESTEDGMSASQTPAEEGGAEAPAVSGGKGPVMG